MERAPKIAVVGVEEARLPDELRTLPSNPSVQRFGSLYGEIQELQNFHPDLVFVRVSPASGEDVGALRLLRSLLPGLALVLVGDQEHEVSLSPLGERVGARLLLLPCTPADVSAVVNQALTGSDRPREEVFLDLARGIADEINNPLMYLSGYLQLLRQGLDPARDKDRLDQLRSAQDGVHRIAATIEKVRLLSRAASTRRPTAEVDLRDLVAQALAPGRRQDGGPIHALSVAEDGRPWQVSGDASLLQAAFDELARIATELSALGSDTALSLDRLTRGVRVRLELRGPTLQDWQLPRTFEPYYVNRFLRGTPHGLSLFLVQTVMHAHGGQALARRRPDGTLVFDLLLPTAA